MNIFKLTLVQIIGRKESLLFLVIIIAGLSLIGWLSGLMGLATISAKYIPIAPSSAVTFIALCILYITNIKFEDSRIIRPIQIFVGVLVVLFCLEIFLDYLFDFSWDIENIFLINPEKLGDVPIGRMSPITSILFILTAVSIFSIGQKNSDIVRYIGGSFSLLTGLVSSVLLIGYLYKAPLLYGGKTIPVALLTSICFFLFSVTLLRGLDYRFWTFNLILINPTVKKLLKAFLPLVVFIVILQGFLITGFSNSHNNPTLKAAIILIIVVAFTIFIVIRVSTGLGEKLENAEKKLKESEEKFKRAVSFSPFPIMIHAENGKVLAISQGWIDISGYTLADISTIDDWTEHAYGVNKQSVKKDINILYEMVGSKKEGEYTIICKDNTKRIWDFSSAFLGNFTNDGRVVISLAIDITERKRAESELLLAKEKAEESDRLNSTLLQSIPFGMDIVDQNGNILFLSHKLKQHFGDKPLFNKCWELYRDDKIQCLDCPLNSEIEIGKTKVYESQGVLGGKIFEVVHTGMIYKGQKAMLEIFIDITERKKSEQIIQEQNKELQKLNTDKDRFISILAHDLKSPFNSILGYLELLTENIRVYDSAKIEKQIGIINSSAQNTYNLLEDILMWARSQSGNIPFKPNLVLCSSICNNILPVMQQIANAKNIMINYSVADEEYVFADIDMLKTILRNLISNAIKFTNTGGRIDIRAEQSDSYLTISISDNGVGIPREILSQIFEITKTVSTRGTDNEGGTGLGLSLCREFVEKHGGRIWAESKVNSGSSFYFTLPHRNLLD